jgi:cytochrome c oxidase subunit 1
MEIAAATRREHYLNVNYSPRSWLLTTDHKRIALLYLISITFFFFVGGAAATVLRLELMTPQGDLVQSETYNILFTLHGIIMIFFFLIPSIPAVLGNFLVPLMLGARDLAFPRLNLLSWYVFNLGGLCTIIAIAGGGVDTGWTFYTPYSTTYANGYVILTALGVFIAGFSSILTALNFIVTIHTMRAPGLTWFRLPLFIWAHYATSSIIILGTPVLAIAIALVAVERLFHVGIFDPALGGRSSVVPALVLVLLASSRVHHGLALHGCGQRTDHVLFQEAHLRLHLHCLCQPSDCGARFLCLGAPHVCQQPVRLCQHGVLVSEYAGGHPICRQSV